jgi:uncharacterized protein
MPGPYLTPGVYIEEVPAGSRPIQGVGTAVAAFLGVTEKCPDGMAGRPALVTNWEQYTQEFGGFSDGAITPLSVYGYFLNGGGVAYVMSLATTKGAAPVSTSQKASRQLPSRAPGGATSLELTAKTDQKVTVKVEDQGDAAFKVTIESGGKSESYEGLTFDPNPGEGLKPAVKTLQASKLVGVKEVASSAPVELRRPVADTYELVTAMVVSVPTAKEIQGNLEDRVGLGALEALDDVTMVCMPDLMEWQRTGKITLEDAQGLQLALINHCDKMGDRMALVDAPAGMKPQRVKDWRKNEANYDSKFAALYYPWIYIQNPTGKGRLLVPPSAHVAGIYARVDAERGVHKAPANEVVRGAVALELDITHGEQGQLNPEGINCIRAFPGRGIRVWGARTLSSDTEWTYINVRRLFNYIEKSIFNGTQWVVFEPNDVDLWERVKRTLNAFLSNVWRDGALFGLTPEQAFYVKCDADLNPASVRDAGMLIVEVGLAPVKPAEFVIFRFKQVSDGGEISE